METHVLTLAVVARFCSEWNVLIATIVVLNALATWTATAFHAMMDTILRMDIASPLVLKIQ